VKTQALLAAFHESEDERKKVVFRQTAGVIFLGSPLRGTLAVTFAGWKNFVSGILDLKQGSSCTLLDDLIENSILRKIDCAKSDASGIGDTILLRNSKNPGV
jgi:hypothetical protein